MTLILIQTFRVTGLPVIQKNWGFIKDTYQNVTKIIGEEQEAVRKNLQEMYGSTETMKADMEEINKMKSMDITQFSKDDLLKYQEKLAK